ncbi:MAG TPA: hypothetical protein VKR05_03075, partial [Candidatus Cybelea sp.]|nr:hypothetical protein [Candidatus Cybelea sp.]
AGFAIAFTGKNSKRARRALLFGSLAAMAAVYAAIIPHEEEFLQTQFGEAFERYCERVPRIVPQIGPIPGPSSLDGWDPDVLISAESKTLATFAAMLAALVMRARRC